MAAYHGLYKIIHPGVTLYKIKLRGSRRLASTKSRFYFMSSRVLSFGILKMPLAPLRFFALRIFKGLLISYLEKPSNVFVYMYDVRRIFA